MTGRIAPDQGREIDLVLAGTKPLAVIEKRKDPEQYKQALRLRAATSLLVIPHLGPEGAEVIASLSSDLIADYLALQSGGITQGTAEYHRRMGMLFGYSEADIEAFIANPPACDCSKCSRKAVKYGPATDNARRSQFHAK